jgi:hypothetical protein
MEFDLIDGGGDAGGGGEVVEVRREEVGDADGAEEAAAAGFDERLPGFEVEAAGGIGPVDEVEVEVVELGAEEGLLDGGEGQGVGVVAAGEFGGDEEFVAREAGEADGVAEGSFVFVVEGGIKESVAGAEGAGDGVSAVGAAEGVGAEADGGEGVAVVEGEVGDGHGREECSAEVVRGEGGQAGGGRGQYGGLRYNSSELWRHLRLFFLWTNKASWFP